MAWWVVRVVLTQVDLCLLLGRCEAGADDQLVGLDERVAGFEQSGEVPGVTSQRVLAGACYGLRGHRPFVGSSASAMSRRR